MPDPEFDDGMVDETTCRLDQLLTQAGDSLVYEYNFGDGWEHTITLEAVRSPEPGEALPRCTAGARGCPSEDVGGPPGYMEFLERYRDRAHPEHAAMVEWVGPYFEPGAFNHDDVNTVLTEAAYRD